MREVNIGLEAVLNTYYSYVGCSKCSLCGNRPTKDIHAGVGSASADIVLITDSPSYEDYKRGGLLTDDTGRFLLNMLEMVWYREDEKMDSIRDLWGQDYFDSLRDYLETKIFFTSIVACPTEDFVKVTEKQAKTCVDRVKKLIYQVDPLLVICMGDTAGKFILGTSGKVNKNRGIVRDFTIPSLYSERSLRYSGILTYHPQIAINAGDQNLIDRKRGITYETMEDLTKALQLIKIHKEIQNEYKR